MTDKIKQIKAEIERLKNENTGSPISLCDDILSFIDSMPVEPKFKVGDIVRSNNGTILKIIGIGQYCYHCDNDYSFGFNIQDEFELVEEPVSEGLEEAIDNYLATYWGGEKEKQDWPFLKKMAIHFAKWKKNHLWKDAQCDDLPEINREVVVFVQDYPDDKDHLRVAIAHRPNKYAKVWNSNLGEEQTIEFERHGKGGWNIPDVKYWLDVVFPKEMEK